METGPGARFAVLAAAIRHELEQVGRIVREAEQCGLQFAVHTPSLLELRGLGDIVHDFYTAAERIFEKVAVEIDGGVPAGRSWHRDLLLSMTLAISSRRPRLLTEETARRLEEFLRFRHLFRNVYGFELQWERVQPLLDSLGGIATLLVQETQSFLTFLEEVSAPRVTE